MLNVTHHHPPWVETLDAALEPLRQETLDLPLVVHASANALDATGIRNCCIELYPIVRDFPYWLEVLLKRSPPEGEAFFRANIPVERRHVDMWRAMGTAFGVPPQYFDGYIPSNPTVNALHNFLTDIGANGPFASAVAATNYGVEGVTHRIAAKALRGLQDNECLGDRGREWLMEHARRDEEHMIFVMDLINTSWKGGDAEFLHIRDSALRSTELLRDALDDSYRVM